MKNYQASVCRYQPLPLTSVDNDKLRLDNSAYFAQLHSMIVNYYIILYACVFGEFIIFCKSENTI